jgi:probable F420-dependent oxidoreductase
MKFAIAIPQFVADGTFDPAGLRRYLARADELGFEGAWTQEQVLGTKPNVSPLELLSYAAACTERIRLGCAVFVFPLHNPVHLAKNISSLDQLSRGRVEVGLGAGGRQRMFSAFGLSSEDFIARFNEGVRLMRTLWTEPRIDFPGRFWQMEGAAMEPKPFQKPGPPVWFGGGHPAALRRAVLHADGFFGAGSSTIAQFVEHARMVREQLEETGRNPASFRIAKRVYIAIDDDAGRGRKRMSTALHELYSFFGIPDLTPVAVFGPPDACASALREVVDAGAEMILLNPLFDESEQMERLAAEVMPQLA